MTAITELLGIELPLLQAPMAGVQDSRLAIAVCGAGALGALPCATWSPSTMRREIAAVRMATDRPYNVNFFCHASPVPQPEREAAWRAQLAAEYRAVDIDPDETERGADRRPFDMETLELLLESKPPVVSFHFGLPATEMLAPLRDYGCRILSSATTLEEARWLEARGVDAVIAHGLEAGGHRGHFLSNDLTLQMGTLALLPQMVAAVHVPVVAAGGIADARGVAAAMTLGAAGVQVGTAWLLCPEADTSAPHRAALESRMARHTALTNVFTGRPARGIVNRAMREYGPMNPGAPDFPLATAASTPLRRAAEARGSSDWSPLWAGQHAAPLAMPAAEVVRRLAAGFAQDDEPDL